MKKESLTIQVRVSTNAHVDEIVGWHEGRLKIRLRAIPEKGKANASLIKVLATHFQLPQSRFTIIRGQTSHTKWVTIDECTEETIKKIGNSS